MLQLHNIRKAYTTGSFTQVALNDVSISFRDNEFVAILGPSGSGKTTLLNIIGGLDHYDTGNLVIDGISTEQYRDRDWDAYRNNRIGFVFQSYNLIPHQTILANVELALTLSGVSRAERRERAIAALTQVGLGEHIDKKPNQLSGGQMQRVAIARALINDPEILLADEPTGALDSKTSVQVMDLLTEIANDRLVIMVTHNPELAQQYATRIVTLTDGEIRSDSDPVDPAQKFMRQSEKPVRKTSMSFLTALALSFTNLMTKKGRTIMTAFAGSIGIIGIAAILALANGVNNYIKTVEEDTLSVYPLQIQSTGFDMTSLMVSSAGGSDDEGDSGDGSEASAADETNEEVGEIGESPMISSMLSSISNNDLASLRAYFESDECDIENYTNSVEYSYNVTPQIYDDNTSNGVRQINPDSTFSSLGMGSSAYTSSLMSSYASTDIFGEMMGNTAIVEEQYDVVAGHWPENYNECVLVLTAGGNISDFASYVLGLRDITELEEMVKDFNNEEEIEVSLDAINITYDDILNLRFKLVNAADRYQYDEEYGVWVDKSEDEEYMTELVENGEELKITGIVHAKPEAQATALTAGVYYTPALTEHLIEQAAESPIVKEQLANPNVNVFSGKSFAEEEAESENSGFNMDSLFSIDENALASAFKIDESMLTEGLGGMDIDLSSVSVDMSSLPAFDASSLGNISPDQIDLSNLTFTFDESTLQGATVDSEKLAAAMGQIMQGFGPWYAQHSSEYGSAQEAMAGYLKSPEIQLSILQAATGAIDLSGVDESIREQVIEQIGAVASKQLQEQITAALSAAVQKQMETAIQSYMTQALTTMMTQMGTALQTQVSAAMEQSMNQLAANMSRAMNIDEQAFANAFQFNLDEDELTELIMSMMTNTADSYENNLAKLGYADLAKPSGIDIYPIDFDSKQEVINILDSYNDRMNAEGQEDKAITYTDIVGTLMNSVTTIIDMISYVLIAFVAISLVVSSIMIGIITYISVLERKKEIGILRSIGASKRDISRVFNAETLIVGFTAGVIGIGVTALVCLPINAFVYAAFDVPNVALLPWQAAIVLVIISMVLTFIAGLIPSSAASRKDPVEALRSE